MAPSGDEPRRGRSRCGRRPLVEASPARGVRHGRAGLGDRPARRPGHRGISGGPGDDEAPGPGVVVPLDGDLVSLVDAAARALERRTSRRGFLARLALAGSAAAVAPMRYLLRPLSPMAVIRCSDCSPGALCCDGWTVFCCTLTGSNSCP